MATTRKDSGPRTPQQPAPARPRQLAQRLDGVALLAGVSTATVSRVINQPQLVAAATVTRVRAAIARTGYVPNRIAGGLASNRTGLIAVIVPSIVHSVFNDTIEAMTGELSAAGYQVMLGISGYEPPEMESLLGSILSRRPDGIILTGHTGVPTVRRRLRAMGVPVIETWDLPRRPLDMAVGFSHERIGTQLAEFVHARGYRRVALITADGMRAAARRDAFCARFTALGLPRPHCHTVPIPSTVAHGRTALPLLLAQERRPEAVVCSSDWLALGVLIEARQRGIEVPSALGVIGFGNLDFAADLEPALTTVHVDGAEIGRASARLLMLRARGEKAGRRFIDIGAHIIERLSSRSAVAQR